VSKLKIACYIGLIVWFNVPYWLQVSPSAKIEPIKAFIWGSAILPLEKPPDIEENA